MNRLAWSALVAVFSTASPCLGVVTQVYSRVQLSGNDTIDWAQFPEGPVGQHSVGVGALGTRVSLTSVTTPEPVAGMVRYTQAGSPPWAWSGNFASGDAVLVEANTLTASMDMWFFAAPVRGFGLQIADALGGPYTATVRVYGDGEVPLGTFSVNGLSTSGNDDSAAFLGAMSDSFDIRRVVWSTSSNAGFGVNRLDVIVPAPTVSGLVALALATGGLRRRRRSAGNNPYSACKNAPRGNMTARHAMPRSRPALGT
jgi:hypothetical protein